MSITLDLHIHSKYSRSCSPSLNLQNIAQTAKVKGIDIIATGDLIIKPGFGGVYGKISILEHKGLKKIF